MTSGRVITFYSYKGGVGRTLTLSNIARLLARPKETRVLVVDFDLEAPGVHNYLACEPSGPGLVEYLLAFSERIESDGKFRAAMREDDRAAVLIQEFPLERYLSQTAIPGVTVMTAGSLTDRAYAEKVRQLDLVRLFETSPGSIEAFREALVARNDFVLVDSRTGVSEISGMTTALLADAIVAMFAPNRQNLAGLIRVMDGALRHRRQTENPRDLLIYPVASRFDDSDLGQLQNFREQFQQAFEKLFQDAYDLSESECELGPYFEQAMLRYVPRYSYGEPNVISDESPRYPGSLPGSIEVLTGWIQEGRIPWESGSRQTRRG